MPRTISEVGGHGWFLESLKELFESSCWTWIIYFFLADGVEIQIVPKIISRCWTWRVFGVRESTVLNQVAGPGLLNFPLLMV